jgi:hypothetical protein
VVQYLHASICLQGLHMDNLNLLICNSHNNAVGNSDYTHVVSNDWMRVNNEMEGIWKKPVVASSSAGILLLQVRPLHSLGNMETNHLVMRCNIAKDGDYNFKVLPRNILRFHNTICSKGLR